jgi:hypothetical protein
LRRAVQIFGYSGISLFPEKAEKQVRDQEKATD